MYRNSEIIKALGLHEDSSAVGVLEEFGTNCDDAKVRRMTSKALVERNTHDSLRIMIINRGKGIHDLNKEVADEVVRALKALPDKSEAIKILEDTMCLHSDEDIRIRARDVRNMILSEA